MASSGLTGILLVGGASRRFGSPKALAELEGETLAERAWRTLGEACQHRVAVGKVGDELPLPFEIVDDRSDVRAPLAGLVAGLRIAPSEVCVVLPVDVPRIRAEDLRTLGGRCRAAAVPPNGPLPGAYHRSALPLLESRLAAGDLSLRHALADLDVSVVELDVESLANVNTPDDLEELRLRPLARAS